MYRQIALLLLSLSALNCVSQTCAASGDSAVFQLIHDGGWQRYPLGQITLFQDHTLQVVSGSSLERRCVQLTAAQSKQLQVYVNEVVRSGLGAPPSSDDSRQIHLLINGARLDASYREPLVTLTPAGVAFASYLDRLAQDSFGRFYGHTLKLSRAPAHRRPE